MLRLPRTNGVHRPPRSSQIRSAASGRRDLLSWVSRFRASRKRHSARDPCLSLQVQRVRNKNRSNACGSQKTSSEVCLVPIWENETSNRTSSDCSRTVQWLTRSVRRLVWDRCSRCSNLRDSSPDPTSWLSVTGAGARRCNCDLNRNRSWASYDRDPCHLTRRLEGHLSRQVVKRPDDERRRTA